MPEHQAGLVRAAFDAGRAAGLEGAPRAAGAGAPAPQRVQTTLRSPWLHRRCDVCGHSFRLGDTVLTLPDRRARHDMPGLHCASADPAAAAHAPPLSAAAGFYDGLITAWPMPDEVPLTRLEAGHPLLAPPHRGHGRAACKVCGHTFRPLDLVVICPCDPLHPRCQAAVHRDVLKQLHCWELWLRSSRHQGSCPGMS
jgi:hypothetical protein